MNLKTTSLAILTAFGIAAAVFVGVFKPHIPVPVVIKFYAAHGPVEVILKPLEKFKADVEQQSNGRIKVELVVTQASQDNNLKAEKEALEFVQKGEYQMSQIYSKSLIPFEKDFAVLEVPFLFVDHKHSYATVDGEVGKQLLAGLEKNSALVGLGFTYSGGYRFISTKTKPLQKIEDFKGLKLATGTLVSTLILSKLGVAAATHIEKIEIRSLVENGDLDGMVTVYPRYFHNDEYKIAPIANELFFNMQYTVLTINKNFFKSLSESDQKIISDSAQKISLLERQVAVAIADDVSKNSANYGISIVKFNDDEAKKLIEKLTAVDWTSELKLTPGLLEKIKSISNQKLTNL